MGVRIFAFGLQVLFAARDVCRQAEIEIFLTEAVCSGVGLA
jgi:anti-anti-sigma regulatory factor